MRILKWLYEKIKKQPAPYYYNYSLFSIIFKPIRKWLTNTVAANSPFNCIRILIYRICGFKIGKNVIISYGVFFACHGRHQKHLPIHVDDGAYIGMRANVISKNSKSDDDHGVIIGKNAVVGACTLVNKDVPDGATAVGIPCKIILNEEEK